MRKLHTTPNPPLLLLLLVSCCGRHRTVSEAAASNIFQRNADANTTTSSSPNNFTTTPGPSIEYLYNNSGFSIEKVGDLVSPTLGSDQIAVSISGIRDYEDYEGVADLNDTTIFFAAKIQEVVQEPIDDEPCAGRDCKVPPNHTHQIWSYNNDNGKLMLLCESPGQSTNAPTDLIPYKSKLYFRGDAYGKSMQVWACDQDANDGEGEAELIYMTEGTPYGQVRQLELVHDRLFFTGYVDEAAWRGSNMTLFVSDGTSRGTEVLLPGWRIGEFQTPKTGTPNLIFTVTNEGKYITNGTRDGTHLFLDMEDYPRGVYVQSMSSESFNGDKNLFLLQHNQTMVTNWVDPNTTTILVDGFEMRDNMKLNDTHMIVSGLDMEGVPLMYITDGTVNGTYHFLAEETGEFYLTRKYGPNSIHFAHIVRLDRGGFNTTTYITNGTLEGTQKVQGWPRIRSQFTMPLSDGRSILVSERNTTDNATRFRVTDFPNNKYTFIEDSFMPSIGDNGYYKRQFLPIGNDTVVFFACHDVNGCSPWKITYPPRRSANDNSGSTVSDERGAVDEISVTTNDVPETTAAPTKLTENPPSLASSTLTPSTEATTTEITQTPTTVVTSAGPRPLEFSAIWCVRISWSTAIAAKVALMVIEGF